MVEVFYREMSMTRFHLNPDSGKALPCRAKVPARCKYAVDGVPPSHYATAEEAEQAYEREHEAELLVKHVRASSSAPVSSPRLPPLVELRERSRELLWELGGENGYHPPEPVFPDWGEEEADVENAQHGDFLFLGSGFTQNGYLHEPSGVVYKVPNASASPYGWDSLEAEQQQRSMRESETIYTSLDREALLRENIEYVETSFVSVEDAEGNPVVLEVQPYLSPEEYDSYGFSEEQERYLSSKYELDDFKPENVRLRRSDGRIVLFDCLYRHDD